MSQGYPDFLSMPFFPQYGELQSILYQGGTQPINTTIPIFVLSNKLIIMGMKFYISNFTSLGNMVLDIYGEGNAIAQINLGGMSANQYFYGAGFGFFVMYSSSLAFYFGSDRQLTFQNGFSVYMYSNDGKGPITEAHLLYYPVS